jgi:hypothetical protein
MKLIISRKYDLEITTGYAIVLDGDKKIFEFRTLELPWLDNAHNVSCIPEGVYDTVGIYSTKRGKCFQLMNVSDRTGILIHIGNFSHGEKIDTLGCILPGSKLEDINNDGTLDIRDSTITMTELIRILPTKFKTYII